ncbi:MAG: DNA-directed RNA polymerase subunit beta, partial [Bacilli bacterium]|nr:DNA-directed RNA polymerase subunit beta [Bacilli bacterium]
MSNIENKHKMLPNNRIDYSKISGSLSLPYLAEIQTESFTWFKEEGLNEVLKEVFPIENYTNDARIHYKECRLEKPDYTYLECKERDLTYSAALRVTLRLELQKTGEIKEAEVFMGDLPLMTDSGTFVVNGAERVIVSQLVRSPGAYLSKNLEKTGKYTYNADLIPTRGTWLEFEADQKDLIWVRIDRQRKMNGTVLLKALGFEDTNEILKLFGNRPMLVNTIEKDKDVKTSRDALVEIFRKLKPGEPITNEGVKLFVIQKFFDQKRYDLGRAGRFKYRNKLGVYNRLAGRILAQDLVSHEGEVLFKKDYRLTKLDVDHLRDIEFFEKGAHQKNLKINKDLDENGRVNIVKVYVSDKKDVTANIIGTDLNQTLPRVTIS